LHPRAFKAFLPGRPSKREDLLTLLCSKRQYTRQLNNWRYFKNHSRHRSQSFSNDIVSLPAEPALHAQSQPGTSDLDSYQAATANYQDVEEDTNQKRSPLLSLTLAESTSDVLATEYYVSERYNAAADSPSSQDLEARGPVICIVADGGAESSTQEPERSPTSAMLQDVLFENRVPLSVRPAQDIAPSRSLSIIEEEPTPSLSRASRLSTEESNSIDTASLSSFGGGGDGVQLLMDVEDEDTHRPLTTRDEEEEYGTRIFEESLARLSKTYRTAYRPDTARHHGVDSNAKLALPVLLQLAESTRSYSPSKVLSKIRHYRRKHSMTVADSKQINSIADFFSAAQSYLDAFRLYRFVFDRVIAQTDSELFPLAIYRAGINVTRTATTADNYKEVVGLMKDVFSERKDFLSPDSVEACLLHSHLGNFFRVQNDLRAAERHCALGLLCYPENDDTSRTSASWIVYAAKMLLSMGDTRENVAATRFHAYLLAVNWIPQTATDDILSDLLYWCHDAIAEDDLQALYGLIYGCSDDLWTHGSSNDLKEFEKTLLFCHLWKRWRLAGEALHMSTQNRDCHSLLVNLEQRLGIAPVDALAALSSMIMSFGGSEHRQYSERSALARRMLFLSQEAYTADRGELYFGFLHAHTVPLRTKFKCFSTDEYATLVQGFVQGFADLHMHLHLSEAAFQDPRLRLRPNRSSSSLSVTPTMLSTPRSSWSGYAAFTRAGRLVKSASSQNGSDVQSVTSGPQQPSTSRSSLGRHLSLSGLFDSFHASRSSSFMSMDSDDVVMQDVS
jgi:hypothetical protein